MILAYGDKLTASSCVSLLYSCSDEIEDDDVTSERQRIEINSSLATAQQNQVVISGLTKYFGEKTAVDDMYVAIPNGECFGLLGELDFHSDVWMK